MVHLLLIKPASEDSRASNWPPVRLECQPGQALSRIDSSVEAHQVSQGATRARDKLQKVETRCSHGEYYVDVMWPLQVVWKIDSKKLEYCNSVNDGTIEW